MQPSFELRIQTMVKAMRETIMPALDPANSAAIEQAYIVMGSLELLRQQIDHAHPYEVTDARGMAELVRAMICEASLPSGEAADALAARALLAVEDRDSPLSALRECNRALRVGHSPGSRKLGMPMFDDLSDQPVLDIYIAIRQFANKAEDGRSGRERGPEAGLITRFRASIFALDHSI